jgi:predicted XRE-type DNA-binding protein
LYRAWRHVVASRVCQENGQNTQDGFTSCEKSQEGDGKMSNPHIGSSFDDFLDEEDLRAEAEAVAVKRVIAWQIQQEMTEQKISKTKMAERMRTSRGQLDRLLDPMNDKVQLDTIIRGAKAVGRKVRLELA